MIRVYWLTVGVDPRSLKFKKNLYGKPEVDLEIYTTNNPKLQFNISHTDSLIACEVTVNAPVDVEDKRRKMHDVLACKEILLISRCQLFPTVRYTYTDARREVFIKHWTYKEAYVKAEKASLLHILTPFQSSKPRLDTIFARQGENGSLGVLLHLIYAAICIEDDDDAYGVEALMNVIIHRTIPYLDGFIYDYENTVSRL
ncbi:unnamed protein product [Thlaspi arvense]|uniref:holo-[acyl-carrier-protein] synthase n=1 Tax=Thlaspi arvense TaxID=13288 RepID=A0AAU9R879_THLAR|nr:unnamed protein product [Thlaspi arvense]